MLNKIAAI
jgi:ethanolamine-phosphate cytidylyltransferase